MCNIYSVFCLTSKGVPYSGERGIRGTPTMITGGITPDPDPGIIAESESGVFLGSRSDLSPNGQYQPS